MASRRSLFLLTALCLFFSGCAVTDKAIATAEVAAAGNDRYHALAQQALDGTVDPEKGLLPITAEEWKATPKSVRILVSRLLNGLGVNRHAFYSISFQLNSGADPDTLDLKPVTVPKVADENADLLADPPGDGQ
jgi:hypothetical protein